MNWEDHIGPTGAEAVPVDGLGAEKFVNQPKLYKGAAPDLGTDIQAELDKLGGNTFVKQPENNTGKGPDQKEESI